jgi:hypothetical protein
MQRIAGRVRRHNMVLDVRIDNVGYGLVDIKQGNLLKQSQSVVFLWKLPVLQFVDDGFTRHKFRCIKGTSSILFGSIIAVEGHRRKRADASGSRRRLGGAFVGSQERRKAASAQQRTPPVAHEVNGA